MEVPTTLKDVVIKDFDPPRCHFCGRNGKEHKFNNCEVIIVCDDCLHIIEMIAGSIAMKINNGIGDVDYPTMVW